MSDTLPYRVVQVDDPGASEPVYELLGPDGPMRHAAVGRYKHELDNDAFILNEAYAAGWRACRKADEDAIWKFDDAECSAALIIKYLPGIPKELAEDSKP